MPTNTVYDLWPTVTAAGVGICWLLIFTIFIFRARRSDTKEQKREPTSRVGILLAAAGFAMVWAVRRQLFTALAPMPNAPQIFTAVVTILIAACSVALTLSAVKTLGRQWAVTARVVEGHQLITEGPYSLVRNPIYLGMFGMLLATGLAIAKWWAILGGAALFLLGTEIRVRSEERLLREMFGAKFDEYARRVPAMFPRLTKD